MADTKNDIDLTDKAQLDSFLKESGLENIIGAMKKDSSKSKKTTLETKKEISWIIDLITTMQPFNLNLKSQYVVLPKLLDYLENENFKGFLLIKIKSNISVIFIWNGELCGILNNELDMADEEVLGYIIENYQEANIDIYLSPDDKGALPLILNSVMREDIEPKYKDLDTEFIDLPKLITKLVGEKFTGYIENTSDAKIITCFYKGKEIKTISLNNNMKYSDSSLEKMLNKSGIVNIYESNIRTVVRSMDDVMSKITVNLLNHDNKAPTLKTIVDEYDGHISLNMAETARDNVYLKVSLPAGLSSRDDSDSLMEQIYKTREFRFIKYFFIDYLLNLAETGNTISLKNIWNYIPLVKVIKFKQKYHMGHTTHDFDILMYDGSGKLLFIFKFTDSEPNSYEVDIFLKQIENIKENQNELNTIKGGFYISSKGFGKNAILTAKKAESRAGVISIFGKVGGLKVSEKLSAQKGLIKFKSNDGFHLNLIHYKNNSFNIVFPEL